MAERFDRIWHNARLATVRGDLPDLGVIEHGVIAAREGGGIVSTVAATRASSEAELVAGALPRLDALIGEGVTTLEIKSGYGLNTETEMRQLSAARAVGRNRPIRIRTTF